MLIDVNVRTEVSVSPLGLSNRSGPKAEAAGAIASTRHERRRARVYLAIPAGMHRMVDLHIPQDRRVCYTGQAVAPDVTLYANFGTHG